jgi:hypothetical protein
MSRRILLAVVSAGLAIGAAAWVGFGVMIGIGTMGQGAEPSNEVLRMAIPGGAAMLAAALVLAAAGIAFGRKKGP